MRNTLDSNLTPYLWSTQTLKLQKQSRPCLHILLQTDNLCFCRNEGSLVSALKTLLFFTILMVTLPIGLYFTTKAYVFEGSMKMSSSDSYFYAAIVAVLAVHVVLALFVYVAWNEGAPKGKGKHD
uniref:Vacuolar ATPase assembly factor VMA21 n=1 Tax=Oryzias latipes TaxID=8090 RepID=A0A3P9H7V0_ORYLA